MYFETTCESYENNEISGKKTGTFYLTLDFFSITIFPYLNKTMGKHKL